MPASASTTPRLTSTPPPDLLQPPAQAPPPPFSSTVNTTNNTTSSRTLRIGTRASALALAQVSIFTSLLSALHPTLPTQTVPISVAGDRDKTTDLHTLAQTGKSLWTEDLEVLLLKGEIDCIVHSLKDVPTKVVAGCAVLAVGERGERRDCVVFRRRADAGQGEDEDIGEVKTLTSASFNSTNGTSMDDEPSPKKQKLDSPTSASASASQAQAQPPSSPRTLVDLPPSAVVGTSSIRRAAMIRRRYPHLRIQDVRGNIGTRLRKLDDPALGFDCVILAGAGIERIGLRERIGEWLGPDPTSTEAEVGRKEGEGEEDSENKKGTRDGQAEAMLHAVGQGAVGLEFREGDNWLLGLLDGKEGTRGVIINRVSWECQAERSLLRTLEGGCSVPVGVSCRWENDESTTSPAAAAVQQPATSTDAGTVAMPTAPEEDPSMQPGTLHMLASVTSVDGTECVAAARRQRVGCDQEADDAGWELARVLVEKGAERILKEITLNRGMVERGDGA